MFGIMSESFRKTLGKSMKYKIIGHFNEDLTKELQWNFS